MPPLPIVANTTLAAAGTTLAAVLLGLGVGLLLAAAHAYATRRAAARAVGSHRALGLLLGFPVRVGATAAALFGLTLAGPWALAAGLLAFIPGHRWVLARLADRSEGPPEP